MLLLASNVSTSSLRKEACALHGDERNLRSQVLRRYLKSTLRRMQFKPPHKGQLPSLIGSTEEPIYVI